MQTLVYLACPYSHPDPAVQVARFHTANRVAGMLMKRGLVVFSPISHSHAIAEEYDLPREWPFWEHQDRAYLAVSKALYVLTLDGWKTSRGVTAEICIAREEHAIPIFLIDEQATVLEMLQ